MESYDLVIVGAGIHGLAMLKTYRDVHPQASIIVLEKGRYLGGIWAKDKLYQGLYTNNHFRSFEFSDHPMSTEGFNIADDHIPGEHVNAYLEDYAIKFDLTKHMRFNCSVESAVDNGSSGWTLTVVRESSGPAGVERKTDQMVAGKLVVATGVTSEPFMPVLEGKDAFNAPIYHTSELPTEEKGLGAFKHVVLLSGAKYSWDLACAYASAGVQVDWVIRESGHGPIWMTPNRLTPLKVIPEFLVTTRLITWLSPCIWEDGFSRIRNFFHQHWLGRKIVDGFFAKMQHAIEEENGYDKHPETSKLKPWDDIFFIGTNRGLLNYGRDFFELVRNGQIRVHVTEITRLSDHRVHLSNGDELEADVLICGTGWKDTRQMDFVTDKEIGLPGQIASTTNKYTAKADAEILKNCPKLKNQPISRNAKPMMDEKSKPTPEPYRLYRYMVPPAFAQSKTLAFAGAYRSIATHIIAQTQALWITAFFDNQLPALKSSSDETSERVLYETVLHTQFGKWRYSKGFGARFPELWFDSLPYIDLLLRDIGVRNQRKNSWWAERFTPYLPPDYKGVMGEYLELKEKEG